MCSKNYIPYYVAHTIFLRSAQQNLTLHCSPWEALLSVNELGWSNYSAVMSVQCSGGVAGYFLSIKFCTVSKQSQSQNNGEEEGEGSCDGVKSVSCVWGHFEINVKMKKIQKNVTLFLGSYYWLILYWGIFELFVGFFLIENLLSVLERHG